MICLTFVHFFQFFIEYNASVLFYPLDMYRTKELYDERNQCKKTIHFDKSNQMNNRIFINEKDVRYITLGLNIWFEENGKQKFKRPVIVIKKVWNLFFVVALTSKGKEENKFYYKLCDTRFNERNLTYKDSSYCILSQVRVVDKKRFTELMWVVWDKEFFLIKEKLREMLL